jgi:hypothetical protein
LFIGITIEWNYQARWVDISMAFYLPKAMRKFQHETPSKHQGAPHAWTVPTYSAKIQHATNDNDSPVLPAEKINGIQQRVGTLLYYAVGVDPFMLCALSDISSEQSKATRPTQDECD